MKRLVFGNHNEEKHNKSLFVGRTAFSPGPTPNHQLTLFPRFLPSSVIGNKESVSTTLCCILKILNTKYGFVVIGHRESVSTILYCIVKILNTIVWVSSLLTIMMC